MESMFKVALNRAKIQATQFGGTAVTGAEAIADAANRTAPRNINLSMFADGDEVKVPEYPVAGTPKESDAQWIKKPLSRGGDPVLSVLCEVKTAGGAITYKELFAGSLVKSAINNATGAPVSTSGTVPVAVQQLDTLESVFKAVAGKTLKFSKPQTFETTRRDFRNNGPDRVSRTTVFQIDFA